MVACFGEESPWCVACGEEQPEVEPGEISRHFCGCGKGLEVYRDDAGLYQVACTAHSMRQMNGALVCTLCGYEREPGP
jgi:hypothetical protein